MDPIQEAPASEVLPHSQGNYEALINTIDGIFWEADATTFQFTFVSRQAEAILGYSIAQWLEQDFWVNHVYPPDLAEAMQTCSQATQEKRNHEFEYRMVSADGRLVWIKDIVTVVVEQDQPVLLRGVMLDITHQKQTEIALQDHQLQLRMALELARMGTWDWHIARNEIYYSGYMQTVVGLSRQANPLTYEDFLAKVYASDRPLLKQTLEQALLNQSDFQTEFRIVWPDGSLRWVNSRGQVFHDQAGTPIRMIGVNMDITQQKGSEEQLRQSHNFLQTVLNHLPLAVFVKDGREEQFGQFTFWNTTSEQMFGVTAEQAIGKTVYDFFPLEQADFFHEKDRAAFQKGKPEIILEEPIDSHTLGRRLLHTVKIPIFDQHQNPQYLLGISEDITERKQAEDALQIQIQQEELISTISRNIRQSLDLKQILSITVDEVRQLLQTDRVMILQLRPDWGGLVMAEAVATGGESMHGNVLHPLLTEDCVSQYEQGHIHAIADLQNSELPEAYFHLFRDLSIRSMLIVPILQQGKLWGLLIAQHANQPRDWQTFESNLLKQLATQVGIAIEQSELYQEVQRLNEDLERLVQRRTAELELASEFEATLKRITDRVRDSLDEDQILQTAVRELAMGIGVTGCNAAIYDLEYRTSKVSYEYTDSMAPLQGRVVQMDNFPEGYHQLLQGQFFQFCSLTPNPLRGHVAMLACPIVDDQGVLGDLWLVSEKYRAFQEQDIRLVQQVANQCAIAIRQARLYQEAQAQVEILEQLNQLKDDFLSTVSHELRTPMSNIKMATQMLEVILFRNFDAPTDAPDSTLVSPSLTPSATAKVMRYFQILKDECQREINLINDLLDLSRLETGADVPILEPIDLESWLPHLIQPFQERASSQHQTLAIQIPANLPMITSDSSRLQRILGELLNNACKYTPARERIMVTVSVHPTTALPGAAPPPDRLPALSPPARSQPGPYPSLRIQVSNTGVAISTDELPRIFDKFYRIPNHDPWKHGGTGLGLALVKKLVEPLGGSIWATSQNQITCFTVELPTGEIGEYSPAPNSETRG